MVRFLTLVCRDALFNPDKLTELIDYLRAAKKDDPALEMKGRTLHSLLKRSDEWHKHHSHVTKIMEWNSCGINGFRFEKKEEQIVLEELTSNMLLADEGKAMRHCVASYDSYCNKGRTAVFSLRSYSLDILLNRIATIEVDLHNKRIVQAKGRLNAKIEPATKALLEKWAGTEGLGMSPHL
ncbi:MAG: PcfJ domain-containing protein [Bacteroidetes bacterium]|nr:PcfJ domain-containing protein [Bacteroidota bacterium]